MFVRTGNEVLRFIAEHGLRPFSKYSLEDLLALQDLPLEERHRNLKEVLYIGISKIILLLQDLPLGFGSIGPIRQVIEDYVQDIRDLNACPHGDQEQFNTCITGIFSRHRGMMGQIARGLAEFQTEIREGFSPFADFGLPNCADATEGVPAVRRIERALDEFFTVRTTLRLLIAHCVQLYPEDSRNEIGFAMHELLVRIPDSLRTASTEAQMRHVGAVCLDTRPSLILVEAYQHAEYMCRRQYGHASQLLVNGLPAKDFLLSGHAIPSMETHFPYVDIHLYFVFFEVLKNALQTSVRKAGPGIKPPAIHASLITGTSLFNENERTLKITDAGEGIHREDVKKVWSYFYSTVAGKKEPEDGSKKMRPSMSGRGLGLAVSRVLVRYFGGEIDLHSIPRKGTDVYIYL